MTDYSKEEKEEMVKRVPPSRKTMAILGMVAALAYDTRSQRLPRYAPPSEKQVSDATIEALTRHCSAHVPCRRFVQSITDMKEPSTLRGGLCNRGKRIYDKIQWKEDLLK